MDIFLATLLFCTVKSATATPSIQFSHPFETSGVTYGSSANGKAHCWRGLIAVPAYATNTQLLFQSPSNQAELTQFTVDLATPSSGFIASLIGAPRQVSGTYKIYAEVCAPVKKPASEMLTLQFLSHGGLLDHSYWDIAPEYSYVDAATEAGYITFNYDRLGSGKSDHPDPNQDVQASLQAEIAHVLIEGLRKSTIDGKSIGNVVGVGHSSGSALSIAVTGLYPDDFDALVLNGISANIEGIPTSQVAFNLVPAALDPSGRFAGLDLGYLTAGAVPQAFQFPFYRYPDFDPDVFRTQFLNRGTLVYGELLTFSTVVAPQPNYTNPVDVVLGQNDYIFCLADCSHPADQAEIFVNALFPRARSKGTFLQARAGHLNAHHYTAREGFEHTLGFLRENGLGGGTGGEAHAEYGSRDEL